MKLSTKGRYATIAMCDIALHQNVGRVSTSDISQRQDISKVYLEQIFVKLRRKGLIVGAKGPGGGYVLSKPPSEIRVLEILNAADETIDASYTGVGAKGGKSGSKAQSMTNRLWEGLSAQVYVYLHNIRLSDVVENGLVPCMAIPSILEIKDEVETV